MYMDSNYFAASGYFIILVGGVIRILTDSNTRIQLCNMAILFVGLILFVIYYYNSIIERTNYKNDSNQLRTKQIAHSTFIIYILFSFLVAHYYRFYNFIALVAHSLYVFDLFTNTSRMLAPIVMTGAYAGIIYRNTILGNQSKILLLGQTLLLIFYAIESFKINNDIMKCRVKNADKTDTTPERVK